MSRAPDRRGHAMHRYQDPESTLTLAEGLREYYGSRAGLAGGRGASGAAQEFFRCHDAAHVVFGCDTTLPQEGIVKLWSFFATDAGFSLIRAYNLPESREIYTTLSLRDDVRAAWTALTAFPRVLWRASRMRRRWPWDDFAQYLDVPLREIRSELGIRVL
ncbi:MAG TPA: hypothetical protein VFT98_01165 [Myxococcota bacterium]|nr:hypothetical protein [Myxococcota bacterium]